MKPKLPRLTHLLSYQNTSVIKRYMKDYKKSRVFAERMLTELMKFFWLAQKAKLTKANVAVAMHSEMIDIDQMWHTFLLFTKEYCLFSKKYFGIPIFHHVPETEDKKEKINKKAALAEFERFLHYIADNLGEDTLAYWFRAVL